MSPSFLACWRELINLIYLLTIETGELLPKTSDGTLITVSFNPSKYGQLPQAKLIIQVSIYVMIFSI